MPVSHFARGTIIETSAESYKVILSATNFLGVVFDGDSEFMTKNRTSFNLWNDFVNVAGYHGNHPGR